MRNSLRLNLFDRRRDMRRVLAVVEAGQIAGAARALNMTQPALTRTIRRFEKSLGTPIFERHARGVELTGLGRVVVDELRRVLRQIEDAEAYIVQTRDLVLRQAGEGPTALCAEARDGDAPQQRVGRC